MTTTVHRSGATDRGAGPPVHATARLVALTHLAVDFAAGAFLVTLPATLDRLDAPGTALGLIIALYSVTALGLQPLLGRVADIVGLRTTSAVSATLAAVILMVATTTSSLGVLTLAVVVGGLASGAFHPAGAALARSATPASPERGVAAFAAAGTVGLALGPVAGIAIAGRTDTPLAMFAIALPAAATALAMLRRDASDTPPSRTARIPVRQTLQSLGPVATLATLAAIAATAIASTVPLLIARRPGGTSTDLWIGISLANFSLAMALGGLLGSAAVRRIRPTTVLRSSLIGAAAAGAFTLLSEPGGTSFSIALGSTGLALGPAIPILLVAAQDRLPASRAAASGVVLGLANGIAGVVFLAITATHGILGLEPGAALALAGLLPAAALAGRHRSEARDGGFTGRPCRITACGCLTGIEAMPA